LEAITPIVVKKKIRSGEHASNSERLGQVELFESTNTKALEMVINRHYLELIVF
jgi:hypothetical protein